ncbi:MAG: hypothetical protein ACTSVV_13170 [Promethearchaeota archaeon]
MRKIELSDLILIILYILNGKIYGKTKLQKMIDIFRLDSDLDVKVSYEPYRFGDFSDDIENVIGILEDNGFITSEERNIGLSNIIIYSLSDNGYVVAEYLIKDLSEAINKEKARIEKINNFTQKEILQYSYFWYPKTTKKSEIKKKLFKIKYKDFPNDLLLNEYQKIIRSGKTVKDLVREQWKEFL